jgi:hypothetical protein
VTRVHGLQHVEGLFAAHLADHDAVGPHTQAVDDQLPLADRAFSFDVGRPRLQTNHVLLFELEFGCVFDGHDAVGIRDISGEHVQQCRLAGTGSTRNQYV